MEGALDTVLWIVAVVLMALGLAGTVLPALPGVVLVFAGIVLGAWIDGFTRVSLVAVLLMGLLGAVAIVVDYVAGLVSAQRVGASRQGLVGAALGTVAGIFTGLLGLLFLPLAGAAIGEWIAHRDALRAGKVGIVTWAGMVAGTIAKIVIAFAMIGFFVAALLID